MDHDFLTIRQIAAIAKQAGMQSATMKAWRERAKRQRWHDLGENIYRIIDGEPAYHVSVLSNRMRRFVRPPKPEAKAMKTQRALDMRAARGKVLAAIDARAQDTGRSWREAALEFVAAVDKIAQREMAPAQTEIPGFHLAYSVLREAKEWTATGIGWAISRDSLYRWRKEASGKSGCKPAARSTGSRGSFEKGFAAAREFLWSSPDVCVDALIGSVEGRIIDGLRRRGYRVERVLSEPLERVLSGPSYPEDSAPLSGS